MPRGYFAEIYQFPEISRRREEAAVREFADQITGFGDLILPQDINEPTTSHYIQWLENRQLTILEIAGRLSRKHRQLIDSLRLHIIRNFTLNAVASSGEAFDHIGLTIGSLLIIPTFFEIVLSHPCTLTRFGDPSQETAYWPDLSRYAWASDFRLLQPELRRSAPPLNVKTPNDMRRRDTAIALSTIAIDFITLHELSHIALGHTRYLESPRFELSISEPIHHDREESQALELHADGNAATFLVEYLLNSGRVGPGPWSHRYFESLEEALYMVFLALNFLFYVLKQDVVSLADSEAGLHPHTLVRLWHIMEVIKRSSMKIAPAFGVQVLQRNWRAAMMDMGQAASTLIIPTALVGSGEDLSAFGTRLEHLSLTMSRLLPRLESRI